LWKEIPKWERLIMWLTNLAKSTDSWLSAASFQETMRILVAASIRWDIDKLEDLKSNVILGRKLPIGENFPWPEKKEDIAKEVEEVETEL
jgi:DNA-directed RNA polymerase subunit beta'